MLLSSDVIILRHTLEIISSSPHAYGGESTIGLGRTRVPMSCPCTSDQPTEIGAKASWCNLGASHMDFTFSHLHRDYIRGVLIWRGLSPCTLKQYLKSPQGANWPSLALCKEQFVCTEGLI